MFWYWAWFTAFLSDDIWFPNFLLSNLTDSPLSYLISDFQIFTWLLSNLTDSPLSQVEHIYLPGPTDWDGGADRLTPGSCPKIQNTNCSWYISSPDTRRLSWKRNFTRITTSRGDAGSRWPTSCVSQRDKSKFGSRTGQIDALLVQISMPLFFQVLTYKTYIPNFCQNLLGYYWPPLLVLFRTTGESQFIVGTIQLIKPTLKCL